MRRFRIKSTMASTYDGVVSNYAGLKEVLIKGEPDEYGYVPAYMDAESLDAAIYALTLICDGFCDFEGFCVFPPDSEDRYWVIEIYDDYRE